MSRSSSWCTVTRIRGTDSTSCDRAPTRRTVMKCSLTWITVAHVPAATDSPSLRCIVWAKATRSPSTKWSRRLRPTHSGVQMLARAPHRYCPKAVCLIASFFAGAASMAGCFGKRGAHSMVPVRSSVTVTQPLPSATSRSDESAWMSSLVRLPKSARSVRPLVSGSLARSWRKKRERGKTLSSGKSAGHFSIWNTLPTRGLAGLRSMRQKSAAAMTCSPPKGASTPRSSRATASIAASVCGDTASSPCSTSTSTVRRHGMTPPKGPATARTCRAMLAMAVSVLSTSALGFSPKNGASGRASSSMPL
mmetsp:Transcript_10992/g.34002  ORF Transcript_10992/g.34002 Transcript_10992/m.34002 type:complete len:306 (-) Transcript_10992:388-1305(-)